MTREGAIEWFRSNAFYHKDHEPFNMAIKALEQEPTYYPPCINCHKKMDEIRRTYDKLKEQQPMLDKIRAEIEALPKTYPFINHIDTYVKEDDVKKIIDKYREGENE